MSSWVRYSVAVYLGLLLAGSIIAPPPQVSVGSNQLGEPLEAVASVRSGPSDTDKSLVDSSDTAQAAQLLQTGPVCGRDQVSR